MIIVTDLRHLAPGIPVNKLEKGKAYVRTDLEGVLCIYDVIIGIDNAACIDSGHVPVYGVTLSGILYHGDDSECFFREVDVEVVLK